MENMETSKFQIIPGNHAQENEYPKAALKAHGKQPMMLTILGISTLSQIRHNLGMPYEQTEDTLGIVTWLEHFSSMDTEEQ